MRQPGESLAVSPVAVADDRSMLVPAGCVVRTGYVSVWDCRLACRDRMAVGDVGAAYQRVIQLGEASSWPCPRGYWEEDEGRQRFVVVDGRHEWVASVMIGKDHVLVAWMEEPS